MEEISGYTRISVDIEQDRDNTSIENQKAMIAEYVERHFPDAKLTFYVDRDRSGYTFDQREAYQRMRTELIAGRSKVLIVKDFSRFSRRNSLGLVELEYLRDHGVRIISINDGIDYPTTDEWVQIQFRFLMNEMPVTDTSKKIRALIQHRQNKGEWVCAVPYGYRMVDTKEMTYEIDRPAAEVVCEIFELYNKGWGYQRIANYLTEKGILTPRANEIARKEAMGQKTKLHSKPVWSIASVSGILSNDFYIGTLRQRKYARKKINGKDIPIDGDDQIVIENAHPPIVDTKTFLLAQEELKQRSRTNYRGEKKYATDYSGYLYCGDCGAPMFSLSRRDLAPAYTCGTYHRRGRKGCTSHHIRVDKLDEILKEYIRLVRDHSSSMIDQLEQAIQQQPEREQEIGDAIGSLEQQMEKAQAELKQMYKRKLLDTMGKSPEQTAIIEEAYADLESDLLHRITGLERQIKDGIDAHNRLVKTNRVAKTVLEVFDDILNKPKLDKQDIALIVDRITVYEQRIDIQLKADIDGLLSAIEQENTANFREDSKDITKKTVKIVQSAARRPDKVFTVNVINDGDPLEIYTDRDGEVIFKKYSPMGELGSFVGELAEALSRTAGLSCAICDRDAVIAAAGGARKEIFEKTISTELENLMEQRHIYEHTGSDTVVSVSGSDPYHVVVAAPIITEGDVTGCVAFLSEEDVQPTEVETKLSQTAASFLAKHVTM